MGWGIDEKAVPIEKIKSEMADFLRGLHSAGEISYPIYSETYDFSIDLLELAYKLGQENR